MQENYENNTIILGSDEGNFIPVNGALATNPLEILRECFENAEPGSIIGGNFRVNFLTDEGLTALIRVLNEKEIFLIVSDETIRKLTIYFEMQSNFIEDEYIPQVIEAPKFFMQDLIGELVAKNDPAEPPLSQNFINALLDLRRRFVDLNQIVSHLRNPNTTTITQVCSLLYPELISYYDIKKTMGDVHPSQSYIHHASKKVYYTKSPRLFYPDENHYPEEVLLQMQTEKIIKELELLAANNPSYQLVVGLVDPNGQEDIASITDCIRRLNTKAEFYFYADYQISSRKGFFSAKDLEFKQENPSESLSLGI